MSFPEPLTRLIEELQRLPGVGPKSAQRLAFHMLKAPREHADRLATAIRDLKERVTYCSICSNITDVDPCEYCSNPDRDQHVICVVEEPQNVSGIEKTGDFRGVYHVLMGAISPLQGIGPDELKIKDRWLALPAGGVTEVILATNPNVEGDDGALPGAPAEAARPEGHPHCRGRARRQRSRRRRPVDHAQVARRPARGSR